MKKTDCVWFCIFYFDNNNEDNDNEDNDNEDNDNEDNDNDKEDNNNADNNNQHYDSDWSRQRQLGPTCQVPLV